MKTTTQCYITLQTCRDLGLVHAHFPHQSPVAASIVTDVATEPADSAPIRPPTVLFPPLEEYVPQLEEWLLRHFSGSTFNTDKIPLLVMADEPHVIHLLPDAKPYICHTPALVPRNWEAEVKKQLNEDIRKRILEPVQVGEATN